MESEEGRERVRERQDSERRKRGEKVGRW